MARPAGVSGADTKQAIRAAAIQRIYRHGYEAMNLRGLAADVGLRVGSLHNYIPQKQEFLANLLDEIMTELLADFETHMAGVSDPQEALRQFVSFHVQWHTARKEEVFIGNMELRSLAPEQYARVAAKRKQYEKHLTAILSKGKKLGVWTIENPGITAKAILALLTGVSNWYRPDGSLSQPRLTKLYQLMVERMLRNP
ncbi:TetR/AcrR family transcriptional regulator [Alicycliphilus denitrificans]|jgi:AcrR family transcriptional regulator|uniref:Tetracycline transcriptional regulator YsiA domain-containing protein n=2 Tax=Alicycliphilus denitrificans TaxID=179636 RepID=F4G3W3_ALIDK|nr:TetR/AcrR family transcriptional regulator C-terminal domain-containing protein [Alicycliphilus denitrificans]GAO22318.1 TetR family transcriptional regulator [Alicycliphilus sp. B1]ADV00612.1 transcriptional regulator [Alicycliphilus denitrificans BC]AEB84024.1 Tetracycline transcriptional regulator YsiA domain-containing protein [Alicycliphilus denitrificans K601]QKD44741.1 TetR/AcrR family transcriptional regulator [Alicycliphilus denitrificans]GAO24007.1 TetR family transcriptional regu